MKLLSLSSGGTSLEFGRDDFPVVKACLSGFGDVNQRHEATHDVISVRGEDFILLDEWDAPCLISSTPLGEAMLRQILRVGRLKARRTGGAIGTTQSALNAA